MVRPYFVLLFRPKTAGHPGAGDCDDSGDNDTLSARFGRAKRDVHEVCQTLHSKKIVARELEVVTMEVKVVLIFRTFTAGNLDFVISN